MDFFKKIRNLPADELKNIASLCAAASGLVVIALVLSGSLPFLPQSWKLALDAINRTATTNAAAVYWSQVYDDDGTYLNPSGYIYFDNYAPTCGYTNNYPLLNSLTGIGAISLSNSSESYGGAGYVLANQTKGNTKPMSVLSGDTLTLGYSCRPTYYETHHHEECHWQGFPPEYECGCYGGPTYALTAATQATITAPSGAVLYSGSTLVGTLTTVFTGNKGDPEKTYTLTCSNPSAGYSWAATVGVKISNATICIGAESGTTCPKTSPIVVDYGSTADVYWYGNKVKSDSCTVTGPSGTVPIAAPHANSTFFTSTQPWSVPAAWTPLDNYIEVIGGGGGGTGSGGGGGGGGAYAYIENMPLTPGSTVYTSVGGGGAANTNGGDSWFSTTNAPPANSSVGALAKGGSATGNLNGGAGGAAASGIGTIKFSGGNGGAGNGITNGGGGGGGAAGPNGAGNNGKDAAVIAAGTPGAQGDGRIGVVSGGSGDAGYGGAGGLVESKAFGSGGGGGATMGGNGTEWQVSPAYGSGGGGGAGVTGNPGGGGAYGGMYGGGGGGGGVGECCGSASGAGAAGKQGLVIATYMTLGTGGFTTPAVTTQQTYTLTCLDQAGATIATNVIVKAKPPNMYIGSCDATDTGCSGKEYTGVPQYISSGLVGKWTFDSVFGASPLADASGGGNTGTISGGAQYVAGPVANALQLPAQGSSFTTPSNSILNTDTHTISFWLRVDGNRSEWGQVLAYRPSTDRSPGVWLYPGYNCLHWRYDPGNTGLNCVGPAGEWTYFDVGSWYHVAAIKSGGTFTWYINGGLVMSVTGIANPKTAGASALYLGANPSFNAAPVTIDDLHVYNRVLSAGEIATLASAEGLNTYSLVKQNQAAHIKWSATSIQANSCSVPGVTPASINVGPLALATYSTAALTASTTYTLSCTAPQNIPTGVASTTRVVVAPTTCNSSSSLTCNWNCNVAGTNGIRILPGGNPTLSTVSWCCPLELGNTSSSGSGSLNTGGALSGTQTVSPGTYTVTCNPSGGSRAATITVPTEFTPGELATIKITAPSRVRKGTATTVAWSDGGLLGNAATYPYASCSMSGGGIDSTSFSGSQSVVINQATRFTFTCRDGTGGALNTGGSYSHSVVVGIIPGFREI